MHFILKILVLALLTMAAHANAASLSGTWQGQSYRIELSDTFNDIEGYWGENRYNLDISQTFNDIEGQINSLKVNIDVSYTFNDVEGELPCGKVNYDYSLTFKDIEGVMCDQNFEINVSREDEVIPTAQNILLDQLLEAFPAPAKSAIRQFILARINFGGQN